MESFHAISPSLPSFGQLTALVDILGQVTRPQIASLVAQQGVHGGGGWWCRGAWLGSASKPNPKYFQMEF